MGRVEGPGRLAHDYKTGRGGVDFRAVVGIGDVRSWVYQPENRGWVWDAGIVRAENVQRREGVKRIDFNLNRVYNPAMFLTNRILDLVVKAKDDAHALALAALDAAHSLAVS